MKIADSVNVECNYCGEGCTGKAAWYRVDAVSGKTFAMCDNCDDLTSGNC